MDLREKKTRRSIVNAFLQLRKGKPLERITVKELAQLAEISKATFYLHYRDIFDLSDTLQEEVIQNVLSGIAHPEAFLRDQAGFTVELCHAFYAQQSMIDVLFSGSQAAVLPMRVEKELRQFLHGILPQADETLDMMLTYQIMGAQSVYQQYYKTCGMESVLRFLGETSKAIMATYEQNKQP